MSKRIKILMEGLQKVQKIFDRVSPDRDRVVQTSYNDMLISAVIGTGSVTLSKPMWTYATPVPYKFVSTTGTGFFSEGTGTVSISPASSVYWGEVGTTNIKNALS